jgi:hypothetical protein
VCPASQRSHALLGQNTDEAGEDGQVVVVAAGPKYEQLAVNDMTAPVLATPAISEGRLLLRTQTEVVAVGRK